MHKKKEYEKRNNLANFEATTQSAYTFEVLTLYTYINKKKKNNKNIHVFVIEEDMRFSRFQAV